MTFRHPRVTGAEIINEPEGQGQVVVVLKVLTDLELDADAAGYNAAEVDALMAAIEQYKADNAQINRVRLAKTARLRVPAS